MKGWIELGTKPLSWASSREVWAGCERIYKRLHNQFRQQLASEGIPESIVYRIPAVAAGFIDENDIPARSLYYTSQKDSFIQNQRKDYLAELWITCLEQIERKSEFLDITTAGRLDLKKSDNEDDKWMLEHVKRYLEKDFEINHKQHKSGSASLVECKGAATLQFDSDQLKRIKLNVNIDVPASERLENRRKECNCTCSCQQCIIL